MPNPGSDRPLRRITLNLYDEDCTYAETHLGYGWAKLVRDEFHRYIRSLRTTRSRTLGDLDQ